MRSPDGCIIAQAMTRGQHIVALCREHHIRRTVQRGRGHARVHERRIWHPPLRDEMAYFVALHEIGHILVGLEGTRLEREAACWKWAIQNALVLPSYPTRQRICACLVRYLVRAQERGWRIPAPDSDYWLFMQWWQSEAYARAFSRHDPASHQRTDRRDRPAAHRAARPHTSDA